MPMVDLSALTPATEHTLRFHLATQLKNWIVSGELPAGTRLTETRLAGALGVSRGPLREAIRELVGWGLLVNKPYKGLYVRGVTRKDLHEIYSLRTTIEKFAFRECWSKRNRENMIDLRERNNHLISATTGDDPHDAIKKELILHSWCYELSGHALLLQNWERLKPNLQFYFVMHQSAHHRKGPLRESHDVYIELACGHDLDKMLVHLDDHMCQGLEKTMKFIKPDEEGAKKPCETR